jgi:translocation and assembly module TamB
MDDGLHDDTPGDVIVVRRRPWPVRVVRWLLILLLGIVALGAIMIVGLNSNAGRRFVAGQIEAMTFQNGMKIGIGRIDGSLYGKAMLHDLTLSDTKGVFLTAPVVALDWRPFSYLRNHIDVRSAVAPTMTLARPPAFKPSAPSNAPILPDYNIDIGRLKVERLILEAPVTGQRRIGSIDGVAHIADRRAQVALHGAVIADKGTAGGDRMDLKIDALPEKNRLDVGLVLDGPANGLVTKLAGLTAPVSLRIDGKGDWKQWDGRLLADLDSSPFARLALSARDGRFAIKGPTWIARLVTGPTAALLGPITTIDLQSGWANRRAEVSGSVGSDAFKLVTNGKLDLSRNRFEDLHLAFALLKQSVLAPISAGVTCAPTRRSTAPS